MGLTGGSMVKNPPAKGDVGLIPRLGRSVGEGNGNPLQYSCWKIPGTEEPDGLQFMESQRVRHNLVAKTTITNNSPQTPLTSRLPHNMSRVPRSVSIKAFCLALLLVTAPG